MDQNRYFSDHSHFGIKISRFRFKHCFLPSHSLGWSHGLGLGLGLGLPHDFRLSLDVFDERLASADTIKTVKSRIKNAVKAFIFTFQLYHQFGLIKNVYRFLLQLSKGFTDDMMIIEYSRRLL